MVLHCTIVVLLLHVAVACQKGENIEALWHDGTWKEATIVEVREGSDGICGQYRLSWRHTRLCEDTATQYWGDTNQAVSRSFCLLSRDRLRKCSLDLCKWTSEESSSSGSDSSEAKSNRHVGPTVVLAMLSLFVCCVCLRYTIKHNCCRGQEFDVEKAISVSSPVHKTNAVLFRQYSGNALSAFTPKSTNSSPMARLSNKMRRAAGTDAPEGAKVHFVEPEKYRPATRRKSQLDSSHQADLSGISQGMVQTQNAALRHAAQVCATPSVLPPRTIAHPVPQQELPTLLQHGHSPLKSCLRKKPPLQGVPPQSSKGPSKGPNASVRKKPPLQGVPPQVPSSAQSSQGPGYHLSMGNQTSGLP